MTLVIAILTVEGAVAFAIVALIAEEVAVLVKGGFESGLESGLRVELLCLKSNSFPLHEGDVHGLEQVVEVAVLLIDRLLAEFDGKEGTYALLLSVLVFEHKAGLHMRRHVCEQGHEGTLGSRSDGHRSLDCTLGEVVNDVN